MKPKNNSEQNSYFFVYLDFSVKFLDFFACCISNMVNCFSPKLLMYLCMCLVAWAPEGRGGRCQEAQRASSWKSGPGGGTDFCCTILHKEQCIGACQNAVEGSKKLQLWPSKVLLKVNIRCCHVEEIGPASAPWPHVAGYQVSTWLLVKTVHKRCSYWQILDIKL